jgi:peptidoglycan/xylan/chitin deacetylase (PgdA/CDA1 family)
MIFLYLSIPILLLLAVWRLRSKYASQGRQLRVLMYHKISTDGSQDMLNVPAAEFEAQLDYLLREKYTPILLSQLVAFVQHKGTLPPKPVLITFDDGYRDNYTVMYPLLKKYGIKANIFLVPAFLREEGYLTLQDIKAMDNALVEYGLHSYNHRNYAKLSPIAVENDIISCKGSLIAMGIPFQPCIAFPYGAYPKRGRQQQAHFFQTLSVNNISLAFRIGNRLNPLPLRNPLLIQRLDIRGGASLQGFDRQLRKGKGI